MIYGRLPANKDAASPGMRLLDDRQADERTTGLFVGFDPGGSSGVYLRAAELSRENGAHGKWLRHGRETDLYNFAGNRRTSGGYDDFTCFERPVNAGDMSNENKRQHYFMKHEMTVKRDLQSNYHAPRFDGKPSAFSDREPVNAGSGWP